MASPNGWGIRRKPMDCNKKAENKILFSAFSLNETEKFIPIFLYDSISIFIDSGIRIKQ